MYTSAMAEKTTIEKIFEAPAEALDIAVESAGRATHALINKQPFKTAEEYLHNLGPGLTTGAADDDPSGM